jgi:hypothetical protein
MRSILAFLIGAAMSVVAQSPSSQGAQGKMEPPHVSGQSVTPAFEGWYRNPDGSANILIGYYNRNTQQVIDIPVGPNNRIEPGGLDRGQPTHFLTGRQWGVFTITVPKTFGEDQKLTWTIVANGKTTSIPVGLNQNWIISPFVDATDNTPPFIGFDAAGPFVQGPPREISQSLDTVVDAPLALNVWAADDAKIPPTFAQFAKMIPAISLTWTKFRGPGTVKFASEKPKVEKADFKAPPVATFTGKSSTTATFSEAGEYILEIAANDISGAGGGGFQCCWTTAQVKVTVKPAAGAGAR